MTTNGTFPTCAAVPGGDAWLGSAVEGHEGVVYTATGATTAILRFDPGSGCHMTCPHGHLVADEDFAVGSAVRIHLANGCRGTVAIIGPANRFMGESPFWR